MTIIATAGPTQVASDDVTPPMRHRNFRLDDDTWFAASRIAELSGEKISDVVRNLIRGYVRRNKKLLESDPVWQARTEGK